MLTTLEAGLVRVLVDQYLKNHGDRMAKELPGPYIVLLSAVTKLREMKPVNPHAH